MPLYEYRCKECEHHFEILQRLGDGADGLNCPSCGEERLAKQFSTFAAAAPEGSMAAPMASGGGCCQGTST